MKQKHWMMVVLKLPSQRLVINMIQGANQNTATNIKLPLSFILYALIALVIGQIVFFFNTDMLLAGTFRSPQIWMGVHFLLLGFAVMIVMGAMYQLVPVAFLTPIWNQTFGFVQLFVTSVGITLLAFLLGVAPNQAVYGGIIAVLGIIMFIIQMTATILKKQNKSMMTYFVAAALVSFLLTIIAGLVLVYNFAFGNIGNHHIILATHIVFGIAGWFTLIIFGFSYKLVPMFSLSHGFSMKWAKSAFFTYIIGLLLLISSFWTQFGFFQTLGWLTLLIGFSFFVLDMKEILQKRIKKKLDKPFIFALLAIFIGFLIHLLACIVSFAGIDDEMIWGWLIFLYMMGWIIFSILGYLYKIVPFLWWTHKYSNTIGKENVPTLKDMINEKLSVILFISFTISVTGLTTGGLLQMSLVVIVFQGILLLTSFVYVYSIIRVLFV